MIKIFFLTLLSLQINFPIQAKDFGRVGQTFQVTEEGFIEMIKRKLGEVDIDKERLKMQEVARDRVANPVAVLKVTRALKMREFYFDPSFEVKEDILLPGGKILHKAGARVNPLDHMNLDRRMIFIDGRDEQQVEWLRDELKRFSEHDRQRVAEASKNGTIAPTIINRVILTGGRIMELQKQLEQELYFDQAGELTDRFGIRAVPAIAVQDGNQVRIKEIAIDDEDDQK